MSRNCKFKFVNHGEENLAKRDTTEKVIRTKMFRQKMGRKSEKQLFSNRKRISFLSSLIKNYVNVYS